MTTDPDKRKIRQIDGYDVAQIMPPDADDDDPHPSMQLLGWKIRPGRCVTAYMPDGWKEIRIELNGSWDEYNPSAENCWGWYICDSNYYDICPMGLFCRV